MMLLTEVRGLPVLPPAGTGPLGHVAALSVDVAAAAISHVRVRGGRLRRDTSLPWARVAAVGPAALRLHSTTPDPSPAHHDLLGRRVLTDTGTSHGMVLDAAFDPETGAVLAVFTTRGEITPDRLLGLGDYALVVRAA